jgi:hypothetical protein
LSDAWIGVLGALGGVAIAELFNWFRQKRSEEENYRLKLYDKRLAVHQQAFEWIHKLNVDLNYAKPGQLDAPETNQLVETTRAARDWWNANALYLDPVSKSELVYFFNLCFAYGQDRPKTPVWEQMNRAEKAVMKGIGMKHIEVREAPETNDG